MKGQLKVITDLHCAKRAGHFRMLIKYSITEYTQMKAPHKETNSYEITKLLLHLQKKNAISGIREALLASHNPPKVSVLYQSLKL